MATARLNHHTGILNDATNTRLIVVCKQDPINPLMAFAIKIDSVPKNVDRDMLMEMASSDAAQREPNFSTILQNRQLLKYYFDSHLIAQIPVDNILMTPGDGRKVPLREIINAINSANGLAKLPDPEILENVSSANPYASQQKESLTLDNNKAGIAKNLFIQAKLMQQDVNKKLEEAFAMDYTLRNEWLRIFSPLPKEDAAVVAKKEKKIKKVTAPNKKAAAKKQAKSDTAA